MTFLQRCFARNVNKLFHIPQRYLSTVKDINLRQQFVEQGYIQSVPLFTDSEVDTFNNEILQIEELIGPFVAHEVNPHLKFESLWNIATHDKVLDVISSIYPDGFALLATAIFCKYPQGKDGKENTKYIGFHQDAYWNLEPNSMSSALSVFIAMDDTNEENGCVYFIPKSHTDDIGNIEHIHIDIENNALLDAHEIDINNNKDIQLLGEKPIPALLKRGCASIHDSRLVHGSYPNKSMNQRRLGFVIRFMDLNVKVGEWKYKNPILSEWRTPRLMRGAPNIQTGQYYFPKPVFNTLTDKQPPTPEQWKIRQHFEIK
eukprot:403197_1